MRLSSTLLLASSLLSSSLVAASQPKVLIDPSLYPTFVRYTTFAAAAQERSCPTPPFASAVQDYIHSPVTNISAILFRSDSDKEFVLGFQGTQGVEQKLSNLLIALIPWVSKGIDPLDCVGCLVSTGFLLDWNSIADETISAVTAALTAYPTYELNLAGHSLGGAVGTLAYATLKGLDFNITSIHTMGQPRVGNKAHADYIDKLSGSSVNTPGSFYRLTHTYDNIPQVPSETIGYRHSLTEYWELNTTATTESASTTYRCYGQEPEDCNDSTAYLNDPLQSTENSQHEFYSGIHFETPQIYCQ